MRRRDILWGRVRFKNDESGAISVLFALSFVVLLGMAALAVDFSFARNRKSQLDAAADAALLAAVRAGQQAALAGETDWEAVAQQSSKVMFSENLASSNLKKTELSAKFTRSGQIFSAIGTYKYDVPLYLFRVLGHDSLTIENTIEVSSTAKYYIDVAFVVDNSPSMGIAATAAEQVSMYNALYDSTRGKGCVFACHLPKNVNELPYTFERTAAIGVSTRIDVVREALKRIVQDIADKDLGDEVRVSVYTFSNILEPFVSPTTDLSNVEAELERLTTIK